MIGSLDSEACFHPEKRREDYDPDQDLLFRNCMSLPLLFPTKPRDLRWAEFRAEGFLNPVCGVIYRAGQAVCGLPLGGIGTGCMDLNTDGTLGRCSIFNSFAPPRELQQSFLALAVGDKVWSLTTLASAGTNPADEIFYCGHYPIADLEFQTGSPIKAALSAWSTFIPGDSDVSNTPAAIFEVHVFNPSDRAEKGTLALTFPGPTNQESRTDSYRFLPNAYPMGTALGHRRAKWFTGLPTAGLIQRILNPSSANNMSKPKSIKPVETQA